MITTTHRVHEAPVKTRLTAVADVRPIPDVKTLKDAIPAKCFERSMLRSFSYVVRDLIVVFSLFYAAVPLSRLDAPWFVTVPLWALYSFVQGCFFTGLWILAHDCGHDSFSENLTVNAITGWFLHCMLMVPFFSWKFSHARHHRYHNHMDKDTVFVPHRKSDVEAKKTKPTLLEKIMDHSAADTPIITVASLIFHQVLGWPAYILMNAGAGKKSLTKGDRYTSSRYKQSHLDPTAHVFTPSEAPFVALSNVGLILTMTALYVWSRSVGTSTVLLAYGLPYLWMNHWIGKRVVPPSCKVVKTNSPQSLLLTFTTLTPRLLTTRLTTGLLSRALPQLWTVILASLAATSSTASLSTTSFTTCSRKFDLYRATTMSWSLQLFALSPADVY